MIRSLAVGGLALASLASASPLYTTVAKLTRQAGITAPYTLILDGQEFDAWSSEDVGLAEPGQVWTAVVYSGAEPGGAHLPAESYAGIFSAIDGALPGEIAATQATIWTQPPPSSPVPTEGVRYLIISSRSLHQLRPMEFVVRVSDPHTPVAPEPASWVMAGIGGMLVMLRKWRKQ